MNTQLPTPAEAAYVAMFPGHILTWKEYESIYPKHNWHKAAQAAISAHLAIVAAELPTDTEMATVTCTQVPGEPLAAPFERLRNLFAERFAKLKSELVDQKECTNEFSTWWDTLLREIGISAASCDSSTSDNDELQKQATEMLHTIHCERVELRKQLAQVEDANRELASQRDELAAKLVFKNEVIEELNQRIIKIRRAKALHGPHPPVVALEDAEKLVEALHGIKCITRSLDLEEAAESAISTFRAKYPTK